MKKIKDIFCVCVFVLCIGMLLPQAMVRTKAATPAKVNFAKNASPGKWVKDSQGTCYRYTYSYSYARNTWLKINGKVYYVDKSGHRVSGLKKYKGKMYYLNNKGVMTSGWKSFGNKTYYFSTKNGSAIRGWQTIEGTHYYFKTNGVLVTNSWVGEYHVGEDGAMQRNMQIDQYLIGADGKRIALDQNQAADDENKSSETVIFLGDSRTVGMQNSTEGDEIYIAKVGEGYQWLVQEASRQLKKKLKEDPYAKVVINLGVNDLGNIELYLAYYRQLMAAYPHADFYFMSVNPVEEKLAKARGYNTQYVNNATIKAFNNKLKAAFPSIYLDCYSYLTSQKLVKNSVNGWGTMDGIHYKVDVYQSIYSFISSQTN